MEDGPSCTLIGCASGASVLVGLFPETDAPRLTGATLDVCFNATCRSVVIQELPAMNAIAELRLDADPRVLVSIALTDPLQRIEIVASFSSDSFEVFRDGDEYRVRLVGSESSTLADRAWSATYRTWQPNGPDCEPTCRSAIALTEHPPT